VFVADDVSSLGKRSALGSEQAGISMNLDSGQLVVLSALIILLIGFLEPRGISISGPCRDGATPWFDLRPSSRPHSCAQSVCLAHLSSSSGHIIHICTISVDGRPGLATTLLSGVETRRGFLHATLFRFASDPYFWFLLSIFYEPQRPYSP
jgi:hypothetical protein